MSVTEETRRRLGRFGVWLPTPTMATTPVAEQREQFARIEALGYGSVWTGEIPAAMPVAGREIFSWLSVALAATERLVVGAGIAHIGMRDAVAMHGGAATLAEAHPGRLVLGLGGQGVERPVTRLREYLDEMDRAAELMPPQVRYPRVLAALGPRATALARERSDGAHPFLQPVQHTENARRDLGRDALLIPHQALVLNEDPDTARAPVRALGLGRSGASPYEAHYRRLGYGDDDLGGDRSDRLVDAILAWGDEDAVARRLHDHLDAGADHVLLQPFAGDLTSAVDQLERLAPRLDLRTLVA